MSVVGQVASLWRYPVKSMRGEEVAEAFVGFSGIYGDRLYAFKSTACEKGFPYLTGREQAKILLYRPVFRTPPLASNAIILFRRPVQSTGCFFCVDEVARISSKKPLAFNWSVLNGCIFCDCSQYSSR